MKNKKTRWVPKVGDKFFFIDVIPDLISCRFRAENAGSFKIWNVFRTKREAQKAAKAIDKILRGQQK